jgi:hypothetical protein
MTHRGGLSLSIIIWRIGGRGPSFLLPWGPKILLAALGISILDAYVISIGLGLWCLTPLSTTFQLYRGGTPRH